MNSLRQAILAQLHSCGQGEELIVRLCQLVDEQPGPASQEILRLLAQQELEEEEALRQWQAIVRHHAQLSLQLQRVASLPMALCDYLCQGNRLDGFPALVDLQRWPGLVTGLLSRQNLAELLSQELARARRHQRPLVVLRAELDNYQQLKDNHGPQALEDALVAVAQVVACCKRQQDSAALYGDKDFVVLLPETNLAAAQAPAQRLRQAVAQMTSSSVCQHVHTSLSIGLASFPQDGSGRKELLVAAGRSLVKAREQGGNCCYTPLVNKRRYTRIRYGKPLNMAYVVDGEIDRVQVLCKNISCGGMLLSYGQELPLDTSVSVAMPVSDDIIILRGQVVRSRQKSENAELGIAFHQWPSATKQRFSEQLGTLFSEQQVSCPESETFFSA